ncbi:UDP-glycosyltransferase [Melia azedarach]|uniref:UDP-glycosyltransferase n=1 Tax=Melia azedarach TaxID=155640 RepID=A0ACC1X9G1_MELAZ|nr:UDP-glycosyltransferase [Melia azedarach]
MPGKLEELIEEINGREDEKVSCVIADALIGWATELTAKMKIRRDALWTLPAASLVLSFSIPKLIEDEIINSNGTPTKKQMLQLAPNMPAMNSAHSFWACVGESMQKDLFDLTVNDIKAMKVTDFLFCNSTYDLEPGAFAVVPQLLPVGPLLASNRLGESAGYFVPADSNCSKWLDHQKPNLVIYISFGSNTILDHIQFQDLALGLELCNRPFLWVVTPDLVNNANDAYPEGFQERVAIRSQIVSWAPQQKVLSHPSIAYFLSHCGWNSTMEGVSNGVPFLCWPYFADQFHNETYICEF